jgi:hypothetical protein
VEKVLKPLKSIGYHRKKREINKRGVFQIEGPEYKPFCDLRSVSEAGRLRELVENQGRACTHVLFLRKAELGFFHFLGTATGWLLPSAGQKIPVQPGWYLPPQKIQLAENRFLQEGK